MSASRFNHRADDGGLWVGTAGELAARHDVSVYADADKGFQPKVLVSSSQGNFMVRLPLSPDAARELAASLIEAAELIEQWQGAAAKGAAG